MTTEWYFGRFESRKAPPAVPHSNAREFLYQVAAVAALALGTWYLSWRWTDSVNWDAWWFGVPLVVAETLAFAGSALFFLSIWRNRDVPEQAPPSLLSHIDPTTPPERDRPLIVDVFFPTYNEEIELVRLSIVDAKKMTYPHPIDVRIHVLDDGKRKEMADVAAEEGVNYITRTSNVGYKAGNLRNAMEQTHGDILVICDADTRPFPAFLRRTLGYFRDPRVAWVQTPQWFYDLDNGLPLPRWLGERMRLGLIGSGIGRLIQCITGPLTVGSDPLANDPALFYDVIQRRRNWCNAAFCCGAGSIHRREAVMEAAIKRYAQQVAQAAQPFAEEVQDEALREQLDHAIKGAAAHEIEFTPYQFHVSEDIYTSLMLHSDEVRRWKSVYHPEILSKMLSPQDLLTWTTQRFKYAGGTLDIFKKDNPLRMRGLSSWQKLMYGATVYSYFAPLWTVIFLTAPIVYFLSGIAPLATYKSAFYAHFLPFIVTNRIAFMLGTWGVPSYRGEQYYLSFFWINLQALRDVALGRTIKFKVTPKTQQAGKFYGLVWPHITIICLSVLGAAYMGYQIFFLGTDGASAYIVNFFWSINNCLSLLVIIQAAGHRPTGA